MIAINWGTSNFRAYRLNPQGEVQAERASGRGAATVPQGGFSSALLAEVGDWIEAGEYQLLMSGMVGSRMGWEEAPYVNVPATFDQIWSKVVRLDVSCLDVRIVPGLIGVDTSGVPEVMRGEETEIVGTEYSLSGLHHLCLPGTHTKWVRMEDATIAAFTTSMTGDVFRAIREGTILRSAVRHVEFSEQCFLQGVARSQQPGDLLHHLFGVRTLLLTGKMQESSASSYLSGLLIGHDITPMTRTDETVHLIGEPELCALYTAALSQFDICSTVERPGAALRGLQRIAARLKW
jgi:2-dehydro-3-deoxygalactonokinase